MDVSQREPHDEKNPSEVVELVLRSAGIADPADVAAQVMDALVYKAYFEGSEGGLRWLDPPPEGDQDYIQDRVFHG
jgi:hypothetical protein